MLLHVPVASQVPGQRPVGSARLAAGTQACKALHCMQSPLVQSALVQHAVVAMHEVVVPMVHARVLAGQS